MSASTVLLWVVIGIVVSIAVGYKLKINVGITAIAFAYIIGVFFMKEKVATIIGMWPTKIAFPMMTIPLFFNFPRQNGTIKKISDNMLYLLRKQIWALPVVFWFVCWFLGFIGTGVTTVNAMMATICFAIGLSVGVPAVPIAVAVCLGASAGSLTIWSGYGVIANGVVAQYFETGSSAVTMGIFWAMTVVSLVLTIIVSLVTGAFKKRDVALDLKKPEPFTKVQRTNLIVIAIFFTVLLLPKFLNILAPNATWKFLSSALDIQLMSLLGVLACLLLKLGDQKEALAKGVPWSVILMVSGMSMLLSVATKAGATDLVASWVAENLPAAMVPAMFCVLAGILSYFSGAISTAFPLLAAMGVPIAIELGQNPAMMLVVIAIGASVTGVSPFSGGGSLVMSGCTDETQSQKLFTGQLVVALGGLVVCAVLAYIGFFNLFV